MKSHQNNNKVKVSKTKKPLVTVIMPVHNAASFLMEAIESIRHQTHPNWELICVNDASEDLSEEILKIYQKVDKRIKVYNNRTKRGIGYSINKALKTAQGDFIARQDADDISLPQRLEKQIDLLNKDQSIIACGTQVEITDPHGKTLAYKIFPEDPQTLYKMIMQVVPIQHPTLMAKKEIFKNYRYIENLPTAEDVDMLFYLLTKGKISNVSYLGYKYRKVDTSNGYHNVKKTFYVTFATRFQAIAKYGYKPSLSGITTSLIQFFIVGILPSRLVVKLFEAIRFYPPLWERVLKPFTTIQPMLTTSGINPR